MMIKLKLFLKKIYLCSIKIVNNSVNTKIIECNEMSNENKPYITLVLAFLKEQKLDLIFQKATELGVDEIILTDFERSIIKLNKEKMESKLLRWQKILKEASEQSMRIDVPKIAYLPKKELCNIDGLKLVCSTNEKKNNFKNALKNNGNYDKLVIAFGPEGGISNPEEEEFLKYGFQKVTLGNQILRAETVPMFVLSAIRYEFME